MLMKTIGTRIKAKRSQLRLNQTELGRLAGLDQSTVSDIEKGAKFSASTLMSLCQALDETPEYLMFGVQTEARATDEITQIFAQLDQAQKSMLLKMARGLVPAPTAPLAAPVAQSVAPPPPTPPLPKASQQQRRVADANFVRPST